MKVKLNKEYNLPYRDYDVTESKVGIYRAKLSYNIKKGDIFNIYIGEQSKYGCEYDGINVLTSLEKFEADYDGENAN